MYQRIVYQKIKKLFFCKKGRGTAVRAVALLLVSVFILSNTCSVLAVTSSQLQKEKNDAQNRLNAANEAVDEIAQQKQEAQEEADEVDRQLVQLLAELDILEDELAAKKVQVQEANEKYEAARAEEEKQYEAMKKRIRFMYEQGENQYFELLLQSKSLADAINKADYAEHVFDYDRQMLEEYQRVKKEASDLYDQLVEEEAQLEGMEVEYKEQQAQLESVLSEKRAVVENFDEKLAEARSEAKRYEAQVKEANTQIAQLAAAQKAAREKAEAEAKAKAEAAAKAAAEAAANNGESLEESQAGNDSTDSGDSYDESSQEGEYESPSSGGSSSGSGTGSQIASYACQFIGNPYVAGGTSLTNGTDCSGFTMSVYAHFGYSIPRTSYSQAAYGTGVSYSEAQPGDIMCYAGHVGIYIGNGMIVHASTPATGIKTTIATYRPILSVRRIVK